MPTPKPTAHLCSRKSAQRASCSPAASSAALLECGRPDCLRPGRCAGRCPAMMAKGNDAIASQMAWQKIGIIKARWHEETIDLLVSGAKEALMSTVPRRRTSLSPKCLVLWSPACHSSFPWRCLEPRTPSSRWAC